MKKPTAAPTAAPAAAPSPTETSSVTAPRPAPTAAPTAAPSTRRLSAQAASGSAMAVAAISILFMILLSFASSTGREMRRFLGRTDQTHSSAAVRRVLAARQGGDIGNDLFAHCGAGFQRGGAHVRQQPDRSEEHTPEL